jgi:hypothetical protein
MSIQPRGADSRHLKLLEEAVLAVCIGPGHEKLYYLNPMLLKTKLKDETDG